MSRNTALTWFDVATENLETNAPASPKPTAEHRRLGILAGSWQIAGHNLGGAPKGPDTVVTGEGQFEWFPGEFFLVGRETARFDGTEHITMMVFRFDDTAGSYFANFFDNAGFSRVYAMDIDGHTWTLRGKLERARIEWNPDGSAARYFWERTEDAGRTWIPLCELTSTKK